MGWELLFEVNGGVIVECTTTDKICKRYHNLKIFQAFYGYMLEKHNKHHDPRGFSDDIFNEWYEKNLNEDTEELNADAFKYIDLTIGHNSFTHLDDSSKHYLMNQYGYFLNFNNFPASPPQSP